MNDLSEVINIICEITSLPDYVNNDNDQSVVEICITRVTTAIRYRLNNNIFCFQYICRTMYNLNY